MACYEYNGKKYTEEELQDKFSKTRRILEVQSDLFQKGRDKKDLITKNNGFNLNNNDSFKLNTDNYKISEKYIEDDELGVIEMSIYLKNDKEISFEEYEEAVREHENIKLNNNKENQFLQLLNKDNNWVTFFIKSIIQDSAKKGYEKVLFPKGDTASKIEGHTTLEEFKRQKEERLKFLLNPKTDAEYKDLVKEFEEGNSEYDSIEEFEKEIIQERQTEISQLKQELERVEGPEGFGALKPIYNFYENTVTNILKKQGYNPVVITDEYGNTWNEITLDSNRDESTIYAKVDFNNLVDNSLSEEIDEPITRNSSDILFNGKQGKVTVDEILENILNNYNNLSPKGKELLTKARRLIGRNGAKVKFVNESQYESDNVLMDIESDTNNIRLNRNRLNQYDTDTIVEGFIHELAHAQSLQALLNPQTFEEKEFSKLVKEMYSKYKSSSNSSESYGFTNELEFVSEIYASSEFREELRGLDESNNTSYWKQFIEAVRRLFGLSKSKESDLLIEQVIDFVEQDRRDYRGMNLQRLIFQKQIVQESKFTKLEDKLSNVIKQAQDKIDIVHKRTRSSTNSKSAEDKQRHLTNIKELIDELEKYSNQQQWKAIIGYTNSFRNTVNQVESLLDKMINEKDVYNDDLGNLIDRYEEYLASYDLLDEINGLISSSKLQMSNLSETDKEDIKSIKSTLRDIESKHVDIKDTFLEIKKAQFIKLFSNSKNNTEVETKWRKVLTKEYNGLSDKGGLSLNEYIAEMLATRDLEAYNNDLRTAAERLANDPLVDITLLARKISDPLNTNSRIIQVMTNIIGDTRDKIINIFRNKDLEMSKLFDKFIKEKGNKKPSELYKNLYEQDKNGNYYLKGKYSIKFKDSYDTNMRPLIIARQELIKSKLEEGLTEVEIKKLPEYKAISKQMSIWFKANTKKVKKVTYPKDSYLNKQPTGVELEMLNEFKSIDISNQSKYKHQGSLVSNIIGAEFHKLPSITKTDLERRIEMDVKGLTKDKITDFTTIKADDIGIESEEAFNARGEIIRDIKVHYRGQINPNEQSLDLMTMYRREFFNGINYEEKSKIKPTLHIIADVVKGKDYYRKSTKTGQIIRNKFNLRSPEQTFKGEASNEYARIQGLLERNLYDTFSHYGGTFLGTDVNKITSFVNGSAATVSMAFNLASGTANIANGFTQLFIESVGGNVFNKSTLLKAEAKYTKDLPNIFADLTNPVKKSFTNQLLDMYDVMGGLEPVEQEALRNNFIRKFGSTKMLNFINESGEHAMHAVITMATLDSIKVMNSNQKYIDKQGNVVEESKAVSMLDMLEMKDGVLTMNDNVSYSKYNLTTPYKEGGKTHINLLIKKKVFDLFGVYDVNFKNEVSKHWFGKSAMMFKNFFITGMQYRYRGFDTSLKNSDDLTDEDLFYSSAEKEYIEGTYTTLIRFFRNGVIPNLKSLKLMYDNYNNLSDFEKSNLKKATLEIMLTAIVLPSIGLLLAGADPDRDDEELWFAIYLTRRLTSELAQFRNLTEAGRLISNPVAGIRIVQNSIDFTYDLLTPFDFLADKSKDENFFSYLNEDSKGNNELLKGFKKIVPIYSQLSKNYQQLYNLQFR